MEVQSSPTLLVTLQEYTPSSSCSSCPTSNTDDVGHEVILWRLSDATSTLSLLQTTQGAGQPLKAQLMVAEVSTARSRSAGVSVNLGVAACVCGGRRRRVNLEFSNKLYMYM